MLDVTTSRSEREQRWPTSARRAASRVVRRPASWARRHPRRSIVLLALAALFYSQCLSPLPWDDPDPLPAPTSTARSLIAGPGVWPAPGADAGVTGVTSAELPAAPEVAWTRALSAEGIGLVADERAVYLALPEASQVIALSAETGDVLWRVDLVRRSDHAPALVGDMLYVQLRGTSMIAFDAATGAVRWTDEAVSGLTATPTVIGGILWGGKRGQVVALDAETGATLAAIGIGGFVRARLAVGPDRVAVAQGDALTFLDRATGVRTFEARFPGLRHAAVTGQTVIALSDRQLVAFDAHEGLPWWDGVRNWWFRLHVYGGLPAVPAPPNLWVAPMNCDVLAPVLTPDRVFVGCEEGIVRAYDLRTGALIWEQQRDPLVDAPVLTASGLLIIERRALVVLDPTTGAERARVEVPEVGISHAIVTDSAIYMLTLDQQLIALR